MDVVGPQTTAFEVVYAKMAEPIEMSFEGQTQVCPRKHILLSLADSSYTMVCHPSVCLSHDGKKLCAQRNQWSVCHVADVAPKQQQSRKVMQGNISVAGHCSHAANYSYMITAVKSVHGLATQTAATLWSD